MIAAKQIFVVSNTTANEQFLCFTAEETDATLVLNKYDDVDNIYDVQVVYSYDKTDWRNYEFGTDITLANIGDKVYFRAADGVDNWSFNGYQFNISGGKIAASGNLNTLLTADGSVLDLTGRDYCYASLFAYCTSLTQAPELPATTLANGCYESMFAYGVYLTKAPKLPATTLANGCYSYMFSYSSITQATELPATTMTDNCYAGMFAYSSVTQAPELPATTLANGCYESMFYYCIYLTQAPELPATTLANGCYREMFSECIYLTQAPELPATTLVDNCYSYMFQNCSSLNSITTNQTSFDGCNNWLYGVSANGTMYCTYNLVISIGESACPEGWNVVRTDNLCFTAQADNSSVSMTKVGSSAPSVNLMVSRNGIDWEEFIVGETVISLPNIGDKVYLKAGVGGNTTFASSSSVYNKFTLSGRVAASGNIMSLLNSEEALTAIPTSSCFISLFYGCSVLTTAPELPATTLASNCYSYMFRDCRLLSAMPELPATTLANYCYRGMFWNCKALTTVPLLPATTLASSCYGNMFQSCSSIKHVRTFQPSFTGCGDWLSGVAAAGTFECLASLGTEETIKRGTSGCPDGWSVVNIE